MFRNIYVWELFFCCSTLAHFIAPFGIIDFSAHFQWDWVRSEIDSSSEFSHINLVNKIRLFRFIFSLFGCVRRSHESSFEIFCCCGGCGDGWKKEKKVGAKLPTKKFVFSFSASLRMPVQNAIILGVYHFILFPQPTTPSRVSFFTLEIFKTSSAFFPCCCWVDSLLFLCESLDESNLVVYTKAPSCNGHANEKREEKPEKKSECDKQSKKRRYLISSIK